MKIEEIKFSQIASQRIYRDYMKRVKKVTNSLSNEDQNDIYMEFNSHIYESIQNKNNSNEIDLLLDVIEKLGVPEEVLKPLVADKKLEEATKTFNPIHVFKALILNFTNGISYVIFFFLYLLLFGFVFLIFAKLINPSEVGMFMKNDSFIAMGYIVNDGNENIREVLGNWFIPFTLLCILVFYFLITLLLKFKESINKIRK